MKNNYKTLFMHFAEFPDLKTSELRALYKNDQIAKLKVFKCKSFLFCNGEYDLLYNKYSDNKMDSAALDIPEYEKWPGFTFPGIWLSLLDSVLNSDKFVERFCVAIGHYVRHGARIPSSYLKFIRYIICTYPSLDREFPFFLIYCNRIVSARGKYRGLNYSDRQPEYNPTRFFNSSDFSGSFGTEFFSIIAKVGEDLF